jgi:hypothetical protein
MDNNIEIPDNNKEKQLLSNDKINNSIEEKEKDNKLLIDFLYRKRDNDNDNSNNNKINEDDINKNGLNNNENNENKEKNKDKNKDKNQKIKPNKEDDKDEVKKALISQISPFKIDENKNIPEKENNILNNTPIIEKEINNNKIENNEPISSLSKKVGKKVSFDDNAVYIHYDEDEYITALKLTDKNGKVLPYKERDISKYLRLLTSITHTSKLKPIIIDLNKKKKNVKKTKIMQRNMDYIKEVEKTGSVYNILSKETQSKKKYVSENVKERKKFSENPQHFFTEENSSENKKKFKEKK